MGMQCVQHMRSGGGVRKTGGVKKEDKEGAENFAFVITEQRFTIVHVESAALPRKHEGDACTEGVGRDGHEGE